MKICKRKHEREDTEVRCKLCKKIYEKENKQKRLVYIKNYNEINKASIAENQKLYQRKNRKRLSDYEKRKRHTDPIFKLRRNLRTRLKTTIKGQYKTGSAIRDLGCTVEELKLYLESQFKSGMTWDNYGNKEGQWSIDHIIPLSKVDLTNREEYLKVNHYTNLQPLWHIDNLKKSNKT